MPEKLHSVYYSLQSTPKIVPCLLENASATFTSWLNDVTLSTGRENDGI